jgi:aspartyl-tRNA synthetase
MCGEIGTSDIGQTVTVCGWVAKRREHGDKLAFVDLRDYSGIVQCVIDNAVDVRSEYVVKITGVVRPRPEGTVNVNLSTGEVEIGECVVEVLRSAEPPPLMHEPTMLMKMSVCNTAISTFAESACKRISVLAPK